VALASEITGFISTNPNTLISTGSESVISDQGDVKSKEVEAQPSNGLLMILLSQSQKKNLDKVKVLGLNTYPDKTLLRGSRGRIYIIRGTVKKHILNLEELRKYQGQTIYDVTDEELSQYPDRLHIDNELIRTKGTQKVYVIRQGKRQPVLNLEELHRHYFKQEIFNISPEEMGQY